MFLDSLGGGNDLLLGELMKKQLLPGPPNRWFLVVFGYLKASRNHLLGGTDSSGFENFCFLVLCFSGRDRFLSWILSQVLTIQGTPARSPVIRPIAPKHQPPSICCETPLAKSSNDRPDNHR